MDLMRYQMQGLSATESIGLGLFSVSGRRRVPFPPTIRTACLTFPAIQAPSGMMTLTTLMFSGTPRDEATGLHLVRRMWTIGTGSLWSEVAS